MCGFVNVAKALADANRVRMLPTLRGRELCACQITELFELAPSTMSKHLSILYQAGLVDSRKSGRWVYSSLPGRNAPGLVRQALTWVCASLAEDERIAEDKKRLKQLLKLDPSEICRRQCQQ